MALPIESRIADVPRGNRVWLSRRSRKRSTASWIALLFELSWAGIAASFVGLILLAADLFGFVIPLRAPDLDGFVDFTGETTLPSAAALARLDALRTETDPATLLREATRTIHEGIVHVQPDQLEALGEDHFRLRVPFTENWLLYSLAWVSPETYQKYEFCSHRRALRRGVGACGQSSLALVSFLSERGTETGFVGLQGHHTLVTARLDEKQWVLLDPDYGAVLPFDIETAHRDPAAALAFFAAPAARTNRLDRLFAGDARVRYGGPEARFGRACRIESAAYFLKWLLPLSLLAPGVVRMGRARRRR